MLECYAGIEKGCQGDKPDGIPTGFPELDRMIEGLNWGELVVVGGRANMGKTALVLDIARHAALHARDTASVAIFSLKETEQFIAQRLLAAESRMEIDRVLNGKQLSAKRWRRLAVAAGLLAESDIAIDHTPGISLQVLRKRCLRLKEQHCPLDMVIIDQLQATRDWHDAMCNKRKLYEMMKRLHDLAKDLDVALIVVSELSKVKDERPELTDFPEYGPIELLRFDNMEADVVPVEGFPLKEFASKVLLLHRKGTNDPTDENRGKAELIVAQNACGDAGSVALHFHPEFASFEF